MDNDKDREDLKDFLICCGWKLAFASPVLWLAFKMLHAVANL